MSTNYDETRNNIINAARKVFAQYGYRKTTLDDIASSIGRTKSSLYYYFRSKEEVFLAVIDRDAQQIRNKTIEAVRQASSARNKFVVHFRSIFIFSNEAKLYYSFLKEEWYDIYSFVNTLKEKYHNEAIVSILDILREGVESGEFEIDNIEETAEVIFHIINPLNLPWINENTDIIFPKVNALIDVLLKGILKR